MPNYHSGSFNDLEISVDNLPIRPYRIVPFIRQFDLINSMQKRQNYDFQKDNTRPSKVVLVEETVDTSDRMNSKRTTNIMTRKTTLEKAMNESNDSDEEENAKNWKDEFEKQSHIKYYQKPRYQQYSDSFIYRFNH